jgi:hypothetical protein
LEPAEEFGVLNGGYGARQALRHVMVRVDHARYDHMVLGIDHAIGCLRQLVCWANGLYAIVSDKDRGIAKFIACIVECGKGVSVVNQQGGHRESFCTKKLRVSK